MEGNKTAPELTPGGDPLSPSMWMYSPFFPDEMFAVEGKWVRSLMRLGFRQLTITKVARNLNRLWPGTMFANREEMRCAMNDWLRAESHPLIISKLRVRYLFSADERAELNALMILALAHVLGVEARTLFSRQKPSDSIGMFRCIAVVADNIYQRTYIMPTKDAALHRCFTDLLVGSSKVTASPQDWYRATFECVELEHWPTGVSVEELLVCLGRIGMKCVDQRSGRLFSRISDEPS